jgi:hypothetical protein
MQYFPKIFSNPVPSERKLHRRTIKYAVWIPLCCWVYSVVYRAWHFHFAEVAWEREQQINNFVYEILEELWGINDFDDY